MNTCTNFFREYQRHDRAIGFCESESDREKLEAAKEYAQFQLAHEKASSPRDAARKIYLAARLLNLAAYDEPGIPERAQSMLRPIAEGLRHGSWVLEDTQTLRGVMVEIDRIPSDYGCAPDGGGLVAADKDKISVALETALGFMCRPRLV